MDNRALIALIFACVSVLPAMAQGRLVSDDARVYGGIGVGEGVGLVGYGVSPVLDVFTREAGLTVTYRSGLNDDDGRLVTAASVGASARLLRIASIARSRGIPTGDLDIGVRIGPSFSLALGDQSEAQRARAFSVFIDPFVRATRRLRRSDAFIEVSPQSPNLRLGVSTRLRR